MFVKGRIMIEGLSGNGNASLVLGVRSWVLEVGRERYCTVRIVPTRSTRLMMIRLRTDQERWTASADASRG
jgi:hypothetical protein